MGIGSDGKETVLEACSRHGESTVRTPRRAAALVLVTETVGDAFGCNGSLKWTLRERVAWTLVLDARGCGGEEWEGCIAEGRGGGW